LALSVAVLACGGGEDTGSGEDDLTQKVLKEGTPEALGVLALVNDAAVTADELRGEAGVEKRAATNIVTHRNGSDGDAGTADDDLFDDVKELDAVKYVGEAALKKLLAYAKANGYVSAGGPIEVVFSPQPLDQSHNAKIAGLIDTAEESLDIAQYSFSDAGISAALERAVDRGVAVRFIYETAGDDKKLTGSALSASKSGKLEAMGVNVRWVNKIMHHKFMIVDGPRDDAARAGTARLVSGSGNWSNGAATKYDENTMFMSAQPELAFRMQREFNLLWEHSGDLVADPSLPYELSTLAIGDDLIPDGPDSHVYFTSANFKVSGTTFTVLGTNAVSDVWVDAIKNAKKSIHVGSGHLRSRPISEALMAKMAADPDVEVSLYLDGQEYISSFTNDDQKDDLEACLVAAGTSESKKRSCLDKGFLFGLEVGNAGADVRYKYYAYRWDVSYAKQMHHKYMIVDGAQLYTGSYNLSDNAEHNTFENMFVFKGAAYAQLVAAYEQNYAAIRETGRAEGKLASLVETVESEAVIPIVFDPMALTWQEVTDLKSKIRSECPDVDTTEYRTNAAGHLTCTK
jgi:phosphatidylserine/phosphatidylglycerophosphate/cardiolipin synthase-like enzyme